MTYETSSRAFVDSSFTKALSIDDKVQDDAGISKAATSPSPAPASVPPPKRVDTAQLGPVVKDTHIASDATPSLKPKRPLARSGSVVAEMRRLFERGSDEKTASSGLPIL